MLTSARLLTAFLPVALCAVAQVSSVASTDAVLKIKESASIERHGNFSTLKVNTFRPLDAVATTLESEFSIAVGAEDPVFLFRGDMADVSLEVPRLRAGTFVPARWGFEVQFPVKSNGSPLDVPDLMRSIVTAANAQCQFGYRLDQDGDTFSFVPTRTHDAQGHSINATPLLDRLVTIPPGVRKIHESAALMAQQLSAQSGLRVSCCQSSVAGYPWGMEEIPFAAGGKQARSVLHRLGLNHWHMRCDATFCFIDMR